MKPETSQFYSRIVVQAVAIVRGLVDDALDIESLSAAVGLSPLHFHRIFRGMCGETPLEMHRRLRLERAAISLVGTNAQITRIAFEAGYETHESFTRAFRKSFALSPTEFRHASAKSATPWSATTKAMLAAPTGIHINSDPESLPVFVEKEEQTMKVIIEKHPEKRIFAVAHRGPYNAISEAFVQLDRIAQTSGILPKESAGLIAIYHDDPETTAPSELRADAGLVVSEKAKLPEGLHEIRLPEALYGRTVHQGSYETLGDTWSRLMGQWLPSSGYRLLESPSYECYLTTPMDTAPKDLQTELYIPLQQI